MSALVNGDFSIVSFLPDTWVEALPRDQRGQWWSLFTYGTERGVLLVLNQHETNLPKQRRVR